MGREVVKTKRVKSQPRVDPELRVKRNRFRWRRCEDVYRRPKPMKEVRTGMKGTTAIKMSIRAAVYRLLEQVSIESGLSSGWLLQRAIEKAYGECEEWTWELDLLEEEYGVSDEEWEERKVERGYGVKGDPYPRWVEFWRRKAEQADKREWDDENLVKDWRERGSVKGINRSTVLERAGIERRKPFIETFRDPE